MSSRFVILMVGGSGPGVDNFKEERWLAYRFFIGVN